jgi:hypothetical protein
LKSQVKKHLKHGDRRGALPEAEEAPSSGPNAAHNRPRVLIDNCAAPAAPLGADFVREAV